MTMDWLIFKGTGEPHDGIERLPQPPPWRAFNGGPPAHLDLQPPLEQEPRRRALAAGYQADPRTVELVNTALYLRRPLLVTGEPGVGKSTLAYAVAHELKLGPVLRWPINSHTQRRDGLYRYDAVGRVEDSSVGGGAGTDLGRYVRLGPLGTALAPFDRPRVLLVDEIDKSDIDLPNDLLDVFEDGEYEIPELSRVADSTPLVWVRPADSGDKIRVAAGTVTCRAFPFVVLTSNRERDFPPAFLRRCIHLNITAPDGPRLRAIVEAHLGPSRGRHVGHLIDTFLSRRETGELATDQLLNAVYLTAHTGADAPPDRDHLAELVLRHLNSTT
jgi:MoxR-like ATPase